ncbi:hypothetical protein [Thalassolituus sp. C2-1]|uniref:hypothetical protein n=1 Tax=Venatorbacter sp. C2-1 TaxID=2597518 RepID=UPI0016474837|nr:hypothetical protein [Thalassolituus sp. C2-1]
MVASLRWFEITEVRSWVQSVDKFGYKWQMATGIALALPDNESGGLWAVPSLPIGISA